MQNSDLSPTSISPTEPASVTHLRKVLGMTQIPVNVIVSAARDVIRDYDLERERLLAMARWPEEFDG